MMGPDDSPASQPQAPIRVDKPHPFAVPPLPTLASAKRTLDFTCDGHAQLHYAVTRNGRSAFALPEGPSASPPRGADGVPASPTSSTASFLPSPFIIEDLRDETSLKNVRAKCCKIVASCLPKPVTARVVLNPFAVANLQLFKMPFEPPREFVGAIAEAIIRLLWPSAAEKSDLDVKTALISRDVNFDASALAGVDNIGLALNQICSAENDGESGVISCRLKKRKNKKNAVAKVLLNDGRVELAVRTSAGTFCFTVRVHRPRLQHGGGGNFKFSAVEVRNGDVTDAAKDAAAWLSERLEATTDVLRLYLREDVFRDGLGRHEGGGNQSVFPANGIE